MNKKHINWLRLLVVVLLLNGSSFNYCNDWFYQRTLCKQQQTNGFAPQFVFGVPNIRSDPIKFNRIKSNDRVILCHPRFSLSQIKIWGVCIIIFFLHTTSWSPPRVIINKYRSVGVEEITRICLLKIEKRYAVCRQTQEYQIVALLLVIHSY